MNSNVHPNKDSTSVGFLSGFVESTGKKPAAKKNGKCIVHYKGDHSQYEMTVTLVNGIREGDALISNNGVPYLRLEYKQGSLTGVVERMSESGSVELRGHLVNGVESGLFEEYDSSDQVIWRGYYKNGERYSEVVESDRLKGYYDEWSVSTELLLSIAQYDSSLHDKNGHCMEYESGEWISEWVGEWMYENGVRKRPIREYRNGTLTIYDSNGHKIYEGEMSKEDVEDGFYGHEPMEGMEGFCKEVDSNDRIITIAEYDQLRMKKNGKCFELKNGSVKRVCLYENDKRIRVMTEFNGSTMIEYDENGKQAYEGGFSGDLKSGFKREGKGKEFMNGGRFVLYSGDWKNGKRDGLGTEYNGSKPVYTGEWKSGLKNGEGEEMDERGNVVRSGKWHNGIHESDVKVIPSSLTPSPRTLEELRIGESNFNDSSVTELKLIGLIRLKRIVIGDNCFGEVRVFELNGLSELESVVIGQKSFTIAKEDNHARFIERSDGSFRIVNCPKLKSIQIGYESFSDYHSFEVNNLPSLQSINIGWHCFRNAPSFSLTDLPDLQSVILGWFAFLYVHSIVFENLPALQSIELGSDALSGYGCEDRATSSEEPYNYKNTLTMRNLPSLTEFKGHGYNFRYMSSVILENIPQLESGGIQFATGKSGDNFNYSIQSSSIHSFFSSLFDAAALESVIRNCRWPRRQ